MNCVIEDSSRIGCFGIACGCGAGIGTFFTGMF